MIKIIRTNSDNVDFIELVKKLDKELSSRDGDLHGFYDQFNKIENIRYAVVAYNGDNPVGCGAIKTFAQGVMEVKRMFVPKDFRGNGIAGKVLSELENWTLDLGNHKLILETGKGQPEAIRFYEKHKFTPTPNFGQYIGVENSVCFEKQLSK